MSLLSGNLAAAFLGSRVSVGSVVKERFPFRKDFSSLLRVCRLSAPCLTRSRLIVSRLPFLFAKVTG